MRLWRWFRRTPQMVVAKKLAESAVEVNSSDVFLA
jgi:hypothetical protein